MKFLTPVMFAILMAIACDRRDESPALADSIPAADPTVATIPEESPSSEQFTPEDWLAQPIAKDPTAYDLPLEIEIPLPELPPEKLMEPTAELREEE